MPATQPHPLVRVGHTTCNKQRKIMKITTPNGTLKGENIEAILKQYGFDCLRGADLRGASLCDANLSHIDLRGADLRGANLWSANLRSVDLSYANLSGANLNRADLNGADLRGVNLSGADLSQANLSGANHVKLSIARTSILPDEGDIIGWKKAWTDDMPATPVIVKLLIPADAQRSNATGRKCRASTARVLDLQDKQGNRLPPDTTAYSGHDTDFTYQKGETIHVEDFDTNRWNECAPGIHFFITRIEAVEY
nr:MAG TPA: pentapeptide repeat protein [Caudoviricetes sp.]